MNTTDPSDTTGGKRSNAPARRRRWPFVAGIAVVVAGSGYLLFGPDQDLPAGGDPGPTATETARPPAPSPTPLPPAPPAPAPADSPLNEAAATVIVEHVLTVEVAPVDTMDEFSEQLRDVAAEDYLAELEAQWQELSVNGWTLDGSPTVLSSEINNLDDHTVEITACIDSSEVRTLDASHNPVGDNTAPPARHIFTLTQGADDTWRITAHSFPDDPAC